MEIALEIEGTADDSTLGNEARVRTFMAASGLNPNLPWEEWLNGGDRVDPDSAVGEAMLLQEQEYVLLTSFEARVLAENDTNDNSFTTWNRMKEKWSNNYAPPPSQLTPVKIFDLVEVAYMVQSRLSRAAQLEQSLEQSRAKLIAETA
eukprot:3356217-Rhodomonas_salina.1